MKKGKFQSVRLCELGFVPYLVSVRVLDKNQSRGDFQINLQGLLAWKLRWTKRRLLTLVTIR